MGINLADVGLVYQGYQQAADAERARQQATEDRQWQLQQRTLQQQQLAAAVADQQRQQAFQNEVRSTIPNFLSGGAQAIPAQPAGSMEVAPLTSNDDEGNPMPSVATPTAAQPGRDNITGLYQALQGIALKHGQLDTAEALRKRYDAASQEGVLNFVRAAREGAPDDVLMQEFNKSGNVKLKAIRKVAPDEWAAITTDDKPVSLNVNRMLEASLAPKDLLGHLDKGAQTEERLKQAQLTADARAQAVAATLDAKREALRAQGDVNAARAEALRARAGFDDSRSDAVDNVTAGPNGKVRGPGNWNAFTSQVRAAATDALTEIDEDTGKPRADRKNVLQLQTMALELAKADPSLTAPEAVTAAQKRMEQILQIQQKSIDQATEEARMYGNTKDRQKYIKSRSDGLTKMRTDLLDRAGSQAPPQPTVPSTPSTIAAASDVARPTTQEEFDALPPGAKFVNPADGRIMVKKK